MGRKHSTSANKKHNDRNRIREIKQDRARGDIGAKSYRRAKVKKSKADIEHITEHNCSYRHVQFRLDMTEELGTHNAVVTSHGKEQSGSAGNAGV